MNNLAAQSQDVDFDNNLTFGICPDEDVIERHKIVDVTRRRTGASGASGPCKRGDERFLKQEKSIRRGLERALAGRRIGLKTSELCRDAQIAHSTFYTHYRTCDEALIRYELTLEEEFVRLLPQNNRRDLAFTLLLSFVLRHQRYFASAFQSRNMYLLARLVGHVCVPMAGLNRQAYVLYIWSVGAMIWCWGECDKFSAGKMEVYRKKLSLLRVMDYGL